MKPAVKRPTLIITLELEAVHQQWFNALRQAHYPSHSNYLAAHITLFHRLPANEPAVIAAIPAFAQRPPLSLQVQQVSNMGKGVAYSLVSDELQQLHAAMQQTFTPWLTRQDKKTLWPHITIQNNVTAYKAHLLHQQLQQDFTPFTVQATAIRTWQYLKGPWKRLEAFSFNM